VSVEASARAADMRFDGVQPAALLFDFRVAHAILRSRKTRRNEYPSPCMSQMMSLNDRGQLPSDLCLVDIERFGIARFDAGSKIKRVLV
jgi:hypothetical protein